MSPTHLAPLQLLRAAKERPWDRHVAAAASADAAVAGCGRWCGGGCRGGGCRGVGCWQVDRRAGRVAALDGKLHAQGHDAHLAADGDDRPRDELLAALVGDAEVQGGGGRPSEFPCRALFSGMSIGDSLPTPLRTQMLLRLYHEPEDPMETARTVPRLATSETKSRIHPPAPRLLSMCSSMSLGGRHATRRYWMATRPMEGVANWANTLACRSQ